MPEMRRQQIRFGESLWALIEDESNRDGVSAAQWIREAALARALWERQRRGDPNGVDTLTAIREQHRTEDARRIQAIADILENARPELDAMLARVPPTTAAWIRELYGI